MNNRNRQQIIGDFCASRSREQSYRSVIRNSGVRELDFFVFSVTVDKLAMKQQYCHPYDPYAYALELLLERVRHCLVRFYPESSDSVVIVIESSGKKEDALHLKCITEIVDKGTTYQGKRCFSWVKGAFFCPKRNSCGKSYYGLEIADFCAYPIKMYFVKNEEGSEEFEIIKPPICLTTC